ncbi:MAG: tetratricopeptide repeat protein [Steroidobacteraceae bacterium]|nr:tetratricopeptide repeat protein [Steroidobacteraceae bacterium]MBP7013477.1 tetratricopeptide repeat protein [Steroidobacteraceae bacterium]
MMKKANLVLMAALAAAGLVGAAGGSLLPVSVAVAAEKEKPAAKQKLSPAVQKPLVAAQNAMNEKNWDEALVQIQAAQAVEPKTPYDAFMVDELGWYVYLQKKDYVKSAEVLERTLASGMVPAADKPQRLRALTQMNLQNKQYEKAIAHGTEYMALNPNDAEIALSLAQARYLSNDYKGAKAASEQLVASSPKPAEAALLLALRSNYELKDEPGIMRSLEGLVRHYPAPKYWEDLLNAQLYRTKDERGLRSLYRLMNDTDTLDKGEEYAEMGGTLVNAGFPNEARQILERGMSANLFQGDSKARAQADLERARTGATADAKDVGTAAAQLAAAKTGAQMVAIGKLYFSTGDYANAVDAIQKGLAKGGVADADDASMLAGIAYSRLGKLTEARAAFDAVTAPALAEIAKLWKLKLDTAAPAPAAAPAAG